MFRFDVLFNVIPVNGSSTNINSGEIFSRANTGPMNDLMSITGEKLICHGMSNIFGEAHNIAQLFLGVGGISWVDSLDINFVLKREMKDDADVDGITGEMLEGNIPFEGWASNVIHDEHGVAQYQEPTGGITPVWSIISLEMHLTSCQRHSAGFRCWLWGSLCQSPM
jgi:hypothetical protein